MHGGRARRGAAGLGALAAAALLVVLALRVPTVHEAVGHVLDGDTAALRSQLRALGLGGALLLVLLVQIHLVIPYPAEIALAVAGYVYGFWVGVPLMLGAWLLTGLLGWALGRWVGAPAAQRVFGRDRLARVEGMLDRAGALPLLAVRLVPVVPFTIASVAAGVLRVPLPRFAWTTVVGYVPLTVAVVLLGHRLDHLSAGDPLLWAAIAVVLLLLLLARPLVRRLEGGRRGPEAP
jgi:uncharacterized membrane protein YdjX (TVP38/TMEM64 family)